MRRRRLKQKRQNLNAKDVACIAEMMGLTVGDKKTSTSSESEAASKGE